MLHELSIDEPVFFQLRDGSNKILAKGLGLVYGSRAFQVPQELYLLKFTQPFVARGDEIRYLLVIPRYVGDKLKDTMAGECIVGIVCLNPEIELKASDEYDGSEYAHWAIGSIRVRRA